MYNVKDLDKVKANWRSFWNHEFIGRPYVCIKVPNKETGRYSYDSSYVRRIALAREGNILPFLLDCEAHAKSVLHFGESLPSYTIDVSPDQCATFFGAKVHTIQAHTGQELHIRDAKIEILTSMDDFYPKSLFTV